MMIGDAEAARCSGRLRLGSDKLYLGMTITTVPSGCTVTVMRRDPLRIGIGFICSISFPATC